METAHGNRGQVVWNLVLQYATLGLDLIQGVFLVPVYLGFLGPAELGVWLVASAVAAWSTVVDPGLTNLVQQRVALALGRDHRGMAVRLARRGLRAMALLSLVVVSIGFVVSQPLLRIVDPRAVLTPATGWWVVFVSIAGVALGMVVACVTGVGIAVQRARSYAIANIGGSVVALVATLTMLSAGWGVLSIPLGILVRGVSQVVGSYALVHHHLRLIHVDADGDEAGKAVAADVRILGWSYLEKFTGTFVASADMVLVGRSLGPAMVSDYAFTRRPVDLLSALLLRSSGALIPTITFLTGRNSTAELSNFIAQASARIFWVLGLAALGTLLFLQPLVGIWVGSEHYLGARVGGLLVASLALSVISGTCANFYWATGNARGFYLLNSALGAGVAAGMAIGLHFGGVGGMLLGAMAPRLVLGIWIFPRLAFSALGLDRSTRDTLWRELARVVAAFAAAVLVLGALGRTDAPRSWRSGAALITFAVVLHSLSRQLRSDIRAIGRRGPGPMP